MCGFLSPKLVKISLTEQAIDWPYAKMGAALRSIFLHSLTGYVHLTIEVRGICSSESPPRRCAPSDHFELTTKGQT